MSTSTKGTTAQPTLQARSRSACAYISTVSPAAAKKGDFERLLPLLAPDVAVTADDAAMPADSPGQINGRDGVTAFFNGSAHAALPVFLGHLPAAACFPPSH